MITISVVLPFRDAARYLAGAIDSILEQDVREIELLAIDDGSSDDSPRIVEAIASRDARVRPLRSAGTGLPAALNTGIAAARAPFIARMDSDDISLPGRLSAQLGALADDDGVAVVGTAAELIDADGRLLETAWYPTDPAAVRAALYAGRCCLCHPSTMMRTDQLRSVGGYRTSVPFSEDFDLWLRLSGRAELRNLDRPFIQYRLHARSAAFSRTVEQLTSFLKALVLARRPECDVDRVATLEPLALLSLYGQQQQEAELIAHLAAWYVEHAALLGEHRLAKGLAELISGVVAPQDREAVRELLQADAALYARGSRGVLAALRHLCARPTMSRDWRLWKAVIVSTDASVSDRPPSAIDDTSDGYLDSVRLFDGGRRVLLFGWMRNLAKALPRRVVVEVPCRGAVRSFRLLRRPDVADVVGGRYLYSGFRIEIALERSLTRDDQVRLWSAGMGERWRPITALASSVGA